MAGEMQGISDEKWDAMPQIKTFNVDKTLHVSFRTSAATNKLMKL